MVPDGFPVLSNHEKNAFSLWYMRHVEHPERDFVPVAVPLLQFDWYRHDLHKLYPEAVPEVASDDVQAAMEAIIEHNPGGGGGGGSTSPSTRCSPRSGSRWSG